MVEIVLKEAYSRYEELLGKFEVVEEKVSR
jgi:hypothetical protein